MELACLGKIRVFRCGRKMSGRARPFAFAAGRSFGVGQSATFALAHAPEAEFGYRETDKWKERERAKWDREEERERGSVESLL